MAGDLPAGKWTAALIGPWWPAQSTALRAGARHWATWMTQKQELHKVCGTSGISCQRMKEKPLRI